MKKIIVLFIILFLVPRFLWASEYYLHSFKTQVVPGEEFEVILKINTEGEKLNALAGKISYNPTFLRLEKISDGGSLINFWIDRPKEREVGAVDFSGIVPGGFITGEGMIFKLKFTALAPGLSQLEGDSFQALKHDGLGTPTDISFTNLQIAINQEDRSVTPIPVEPDHVPPDNFTPQIVSHPEVFNGDKVLVFSATDQGSGLSSYYVREYRVPFLKYLSAWKQVESPYRLEDQSRSSYIEIKAVDEAGNERLVQLLPDNNSSNYYGYWFWLLLLVLIFIYFRGKDNLKFRW